MKKYGDDRGGQLSALVAFSAFLSFFPLMLVVVTVTALLSHRSPDLAERIRSSAIAEFPVVGAELAGGGQGLPGSGLGLVAGLALLLWGGLGFTQAIQYAFHEVWQVPHKDRPSFANRLRRGVALVGLLVIGLGFGMVLTLLGSFVIGSIAISIVGFVGGCVLNAALYLAVLWLLSPRDVSLADLLPGAAVAGVAWQALQTIGVGLVGHQLRRSSELYGAIGAALGLVWFLLLSTQIFLLALEVVVVRKDRLWPRSLMQPPFTPADITVMSAKAKQQERRPEQHVTIRFGPTDASPPERDGTRQE